MSARLIVNHVVNILELMQIDTYNCISFQVRGISSLDGREGDRKDFPGEAGPEDPEDMPICVFGHECSYL